MAAAAGTGLLDGRLFGSGDRVDSEPVVIINQTLADRYFPGQSPVGRRISLAAMDPNAPWRRVIGVVQDVKHAGLDWDYLPEMFIPYEQLIPGTLASDTLGGDMYVVYRASSTLAPTNRTLREIVASLDSNLPITELMTGSAIVSRVVRQAKLQSIAMGSISAMTVLLSALGLFALLSRSVSQRRLEFGIRMALGASPKRLLALIYRQVSKLAVIGVGLGLAASVVLAPYIQSLLFNVKATQPLVLALAALFMFAVILVAASVPAFRAISLTPMRAIRRA